MANIRVLPFGLAGAIVSAALMLLLSLVALAGWYEGAADMMQQWHAFYSLDAGGIVAGMVEAAIITFVGLAAFAWTYNRLQERLQ